jgi:hypothetical protein
LFRRNHGSEPAEPAAVRGDQRRLTAAGIGAGRIAVGAIFFANPVLSVRFLGVDGGTAARLDWLARMAAARDAAIGAGTLISARTGRGMTGWLLAGAVCDAADAAVIGHALAHRRISVIPGAVVVAGAAVGSAVAVAIALPGRGRRHQTSSLS